VGTEAIAGAQPRCGREPLRHSLRDCHLPFEKGRILWRRCLLRRAHVTNKSAILLGFLGQFVIPILDIKNPYGYL
jgi:hypothetical protein